MTSPDVTDIWHVCAGWLRFSTAADVAELYAPLGLKDRFRNFRNLNASKRFGNSETA